MQAPERAWTWPKKRSRVRVAEKREISSACSLPRGSAAEPRCHPEAPKRQRIPNGRRICYDDRHQQPEQRRKTRHGVFHAHNTHRGGERERDGLRRATGLRERERARGGEALILAHYGAG